jgi:polysaccharide pyruvyl transferase WcaK-like protein
MKIALIGYYNHKNYGDDRILYCLTRYFSDHDFLIFGSWQEAESELEEINRCDYILIGGGGLILRDIGTCTGFVEKLKKPFALIGIGIEAEHRSMNSFFEVVKEKAVFILLRDNESRRILGDHHKVIVGPDLTFLFPFAVVPEHKKDVCGLNLRDWYYWEGVLYGRYYNIMRRLDAAVPYLKYFYPLPKWEPAKVVKTVKNRFENSFPIPFYFEPDFFNDTRLLSRYYEKVPDNFDISLYNDIRYLIGMRFHSIVFAVQCGIPFISLSYQPKNIAICTEMGFPELSLSIYKTGRLEEKIDYVKTHYTTIRERLISLRSQFVRDMEYVMKSLSPLVNISPHR